MPSVFNANKGRFQDAVYVGRPTKYGNPFVIGRDGDRDEVCDRYEEHIARELARYPGLRDQIKRDLGGKDLVCFCAPQRCHADTLLRIANEEDNGTKPMEEKA